MLIRLPSARRLTARCRGPEAVRRRMRAINEYQLLPLGRVYFQTKSQFWRNDPLGQLGAIAFAQPGQLSWILDAS